MSGIDNKELEKMLERAAARGAMLALSMVKTSANEWLTTDEALRMLNISSYTQLYKLHSGGLIKDNGEAYNRRRWSAASIRKYLKITK